MYEKRHGLVFPISPLRPMKHFSVSDTLGNSNTPSTLVPDPQSLIQTDVYVWVDGLGSLVPKPLSLEALVKERLSSWI